MYCYYLEEFNFILYMAEEVDNTTPETGTTTPETGGESNNESTNNPKIEVIAPMPDVNIDQHDYSSYFSDIADYIEVIKNIDEEEHEVNKTAPKDYWDKLRHQYFITVLQSILTRTGVFQIDQLINISYKITTAAINKMKSTTD